MNEIQQKPTTPTHHNLSGGQIAGIMAGVIAFLFVIGVMLITPFCKRGTPEPRPSSWQIAEGTLQAPV